MAQETLRDATEKLTAQGWFPPPVFPAPPLGGPGPGATGSRFRV